MFRLLALTETAGGQLDGPIATLQYQHERGRSLVNAIADALPGYAEGHEQKHTVILENVAAFCALLREHVNCEDNVFYPMVKAVLTDAQSHQLLLEFEKAEEKMGPSFFDDSAERVAKMAKLVRE